MLWLFAFIPYAPEVLLETWAELKKKKSVGHTWTAAVRFALMIGVGFLLRWLGDTVYWWQGTVLSFAIFFALFDHTYNWITGRPFAYLRAKGIDKIFAELPILFRVFIRLTVLAAAIWLYLRPEALFTWDN